MPRFLEFGVLATLLVGGIVPAQIPVGVFAPAFDFQSVVEHGPRSFDDLDGKVLLIAFSESSSRPCEAAVPRLNALQARFADRGLIVLSVFAEPPKSFYGVFISRLGARYPVAVVTATAMLQYGVEGLPAMILVDVDGRVRSRSSRVPSAALVGDLVRDVAVVPELPKGTPFDTLRRQWGKKRYREVRDGLDKMLKQEDLAPETWAMLDAFRAALQKRVDSQERRVQACAKGPDYYRAEVLLTKIVAEWRGFAVAEDAQELLSRFKTEATIKREVRSGRALEKLMSKYDVGNQGQAKKLMAALYKFSKSKSHVGTHAAKLALARLGG